MPCERPRCALRSFTGVKARLAPGSGTLLSFTLSVGGALSQPSSDLFSYPRSVALARALGRSSNGARSPPVIAKLRGCPEVAGAWAPVHRGPLIRAHTCCS